MNEYIHFIAQNYLLFGALIAVLGAIIWVEFNRLGTGVKQLGPQEIVRLMNSEDSIVVDVREDAEIREGKLIKAKHIPLGDLPKRLNELEKHKNKTIIVYCRSGNRSSRACRMLQKAGFQNVANLRGGILSWKEANMPVKKGR